MPMRPAVFAFVALLALSCGKDGPGDPSPTGETCCCQITRDPVSCQVVSKTSCTDGKTCTSSTACPSGQCRSKPTGDDEGAYDEEAAYEDEAAAEGVE
jgi:hypothetical protein